MDDKQIDLDAIEKRLVAASPGPWYKCTASDGECQCGFIWDHDERVPVCSAIKIDEECGERSEEQFQANKDFIAHARQDVPALIAEVRRLRAGWHRTEDVLPPSGVPVLTFSNCPDDDYCPKVGYDVTEYDERLGWGDPLNGYDMDEKSPSYWCEIPDPSQRQALRHQENVLEGESEETWWSYECFGKCTEDAKSSGVVLDFRTDDQFVDPYGNAPTSKVLCPICGDRMTPKDRWPAKGYRQHAEKQLEDAWKDMDLERLDWLADVNARAAVIDKLRKHLAEAYAIMTASEWDEDERCPYCRCSTPMEHVKGCGLHRVRVECGNVLGEAQVKRDPVIS